MFTEDGLVKLTDYGLTTLMNTFKEDRTTLLHKAPEAFEGKRELKSDVWSLGITLFELAQRWNPFDSAACGKEGWVICSENVPTLSLNKWSPAFVDFVSKCLVKDVRERPSVRELMDVSV